MDSRHEVVVLDNLTEGHRAAVHPGARFVEADIADQAALRDVFQKHGPGAVIHFAAYSLVGESMKAPGRYFRNNVANALNLLETCVAAGVGKFVFSSTAATYGVPSSVPIDEGCPAVPINPYGCSKLMVEQMLEWFGSVHGLEHVVFRYFNAAGASRTRGEDHRVETHLIPNLLKVALGQKPHC